MPKPAEIKTKQTEASVEDFLATLPDEAQRADSKALIKMMQKATKEKPKVWGNSMIGFGLKRYKSDSGREVDWFHIGFAPRKANLSLHLVMDMEKQSKTLAKLGKHKTGKGCLYINKLADVDLNILNELIETAAAKKS